MMGGLGCIDHFAEIPGFENQTNEQDTLDMKLVDLKRVFLFLFHSVLVLLAGRTISWVTLLGKIFDGGNMEKVWKWKVLRKA